MLPARQYPAGYAAVIEAAASPPGPVRGRRARTGTSGTAALRVRFRRPGRVRVRVTAPGSRPARATIRVLSRR